MIIYPTAKQALAAARAAHHASTPANVERHLAGRFGFGSLGKLADVDPDAWFESQLAVARRHRGYAGVAGLTSAFSSLPLEPAEVRRWLKARGNEWNLVAMNELEAATLVLQTWSGAQLYEAVVDAFSNILNVANMQVNIWCARGSYDRTVIRANALGSYSDMLLAAAKHPAMLVYLDNALSYKNAPNENYGRELLELHTVTPAAGYTQNDVVNSARLLTGRLVNFANTSYVYNMQQHWTGPVHVLDFADPNANPRQGEAVGDAYLRYLAMHPSTARNIARRLCLRFVSDAPTAALVNAVAQVYLDNNSAIIPMLRAILRSREFWASAGAKTRRPIENLVATLRITGTRPGRSLHATGLLLGQLCTQLGQRPLAWAAPNGYPDVGPVWQTAGALVEEWRLQWELMNSTLGPDLRRPALASYLGAHQPRTVHNALAALHQRLLGVPLGAAEEKVLLDYLGDSRTTSMRRSHLKSQLGDVAALMLHGSRHAVR